MEHDSSEKGSDIRNCVARSPINDGSNVRRIWYLSLRGTAVSDNRELVGTEHEFLPRECSSSLLHTLDDTVDVLKMLPDETTNKTVVGDCLVGTDSKEVVG